MGQVRLRFSSCDASLWVPSFSACSGALDGVSWVQSGLVESAVDGACAVACYRIGAVLCSLPRGVRSARELGAFSYFSATAIWSRQAAGENEVPWRSIACMITASRRASTGSSPGTGAAGDLGGRASFCKHFLCTSKEKYPDCGSGTAITF